MIAKNLVMILMFMFLAVGIMFNGTGVVLAQDNSGSGSTDDDSDDNSSSSGSGNDDSGVDNSGSGSDDDSDDDSDEENDDSSGRGSGDLRDRIRERVRNGESEFERRIELPDGREIRIERKIESDNGEFRVRIERRIIDADGNERRVKIEIERDDDNSARKIRVESEGRNESVEIDSEIEIDDTFEGNESELEAVTSDGSRKRIKFLPDEVKQRVRERLRIRSENITNISLEEVTDRNIPRVVYNVRTNQNGRFLGIFKLAMESEVKVDPETGEVVDINRPWWAFLVNEEEVPEDLDLNETEDEGNETNSSV